MRSSLIRFFIDWVVSVAPSLTISPPLVCEIDLPVDLSVQCCIRCNFRLRNDNWRIPRLPEQPFRFYRSQRMDAYPFVRQGSRVFWNKFGLVHGVQSCCVDALIYIKVMPQNWLSEVKRLADVT